MIIPVTYYFVLGSQNFLLMEEPLEEILRERIQYYQLIKKNVDFWILPNPKFLDVVKLTEKEFIQIKKIPILAIVSTNKIFITWLKLRLNNVIIGELNGPSLNLPSPLSYEKITNLKQFELKT